jgi:hypothetical protein
MQGFIDVPSVLTPDCVLVAVRPRTSAKQNDAGISKPDVVLGEDPTIHQRRPLAVRSR